MPSDAKKVLFLCTHNSARSQMAEGLLRYLALSNGISVISLSAGTEKTHVRPLAIKAMQEIGIDISSHTSKTLDVYLHEPIDVVITVCDSANDSCPVFTKGKKRLHWSFPDPSKAMGNEEDQLQVYREVRDAIRKRIEEELLSRLDE
ncbi:hypothetical protein HK098_005211 [Nowakowskiella sp. JEL0407]|nr:hypothetical protein HK098_005211 [Nowakowskiella sp. JEL0407]